MFGEKLSDGRCKIKDLALEVAKITGIDRVEIRHRLIRLDDRSISKAYGPMKKMVFDCRLAGGLGYHVLVGSLRSPRWSPMQ